MAEYWELQFTLPNSENQKIINVFLRSLKNAGKGKDTLYIHRRVLGDFFLFYGAEFTSITSNDIEQWFEIKRKELSEITIRNYKGYLRSFYTYCLEQGHIEQSPIKLKSKKQFWELRDTLPNKENQNIIEEFLLKIGDSSKNMYTINQARGVLQLFFSQLDKPFDGITIEDIQDWFNEHPEWEKETKGKYKTSLKKFYLFCYEEGYIDNLPLNETKMDGVNENYWNIQRPFASQVNMNIIDEYILHLKENDRNKNVVQDSKIVLQNFFREREEHFSLITPEHVWEWINEINLSRKKTTVKSYLGYVRSFYCYCVNKGYMKESPILYQWEFTEKDKKYWKVNIPLANKENSDVINEFLINMKITNLSKITIENYRFFLQKFFLEKQEPFYKLPSDDIKKWFMGYINVWKESTFTSYLKILSTFYGYCVEEGYMKKNPIKSYWYPRLPKSVPKYLEKQELAKVRYESEKETIRNQSIVEFFLVSGCRVGEVYRLNRTDVNFENRTAHVIGKGKKLRTVHFTEKCALLLRQYLETRTDENPALFISQFGKRLGVATLESMIKEIGIRAELSSSLYPHRLRHTFATELLAKGADLSFIADELGHKSLATTQIYARLQNQELISMYRKYMG